MGRKHRQPLRALADEVARARPEIQDPARSIRAGQIVVDGVIRTNPRSLVRAGSTVALRTPPTLRGERKLQSALGLLDADVSNRIALDLGAAAGGFTRALLSAGARRVYAVDAGYGQLLGSLRQDARVVNLERTNLGALNRRLVPDVVDVVTIDVSYLAIARVVGQLEPLAIGAGADLVALVKPMFELRAPSAPSEPDELARALHYAKGGLEAGRWRVETSIRSPWVGSRGAVEFFVHARRAQE